MSIDHRAEAEKHLAHAAHHLTEDPGDMRIAEVSAWIGQGHANLVRNEEPAATTRDLKDALHSLRRRFDDTRSLVAEHIAKGLASREADRWKAALELTKALDAAYCNLDDLVDARLEENGWDPRSAYKTPAGSGGWIGFAAEKNAERDPWAQTPDTTAEIPEPIRRVIAGHLAEMLLDPTAGAVHTWARGIAFELKNAGADLTPDIEKRIRDLTLGRDPSEPPF